jgi:hypothetical protein
VGGAFSVGSVLNQNIAGYQFFWGVIYSQNITLKIKSAKLM